MKFYQGGCEKKGKYNPSSVQARGATAGLLAPMETSEAFPFRIWAEWRPIPETCLWTFFQTASISAKPQPLSEFMDLWWGSVIFCKVVQQLSRFAGLAWSIRNAEDGGGCP